MPNSEVRSAPATCLLCQNDKILPLFDNGGSEICRCLSCGVIFRNPQPSNDELAAIYSEDYFLGQETAERRSATEGIKRATARRYLGYIADYMSAKAIAGKGLKLLEVGCGFGFLLKEAATAGYDVTGIEHSPSSVAVANALLGRDAVIAGEVETCGIEDGSFDVCVLSDVIEHVRDPLEFLRHVRRLLKKDGVLFIATPDVGSLAARLMGRRWVEYKIEHLYYFNAETTGFMLSRTGFSQIRSYKATKTLSLEYITDHFSRFPFPGLTLGMKMLTRLVPNGLKRHPFAISPGGLVVVCRKDPDGE